MTAVMVGMGETKALSKSEARLQAGGLGSCIGLCLYEAGMRIAVMVHIVLPQTLPQSSRTNPSTIDPLPGKFADTAIPFALTEIERLGGKREQVQVALVGGAHIFHQSGAGSLPIPQLEIGKRNVTAVKEALIREGIPIRAEESGGQCGRTVTMDSTTGSVWVRPVGLNERLLVTLGQPNNPSALKSQGAGLHGH